MKGKGVNFDVGIEFHQGYMSRPMFATSIMQRELEIIQQDLHCNAIRISGTDIDRLVIVSEEALEQGLEVWLSPHLHDNNQQETLEYTVKCASTAEKLRQQWPQLIYILGCELTWFMQGILPGNNFRRVSPRDRYRLQRKFCKVIDRNSKVITC